MRSVRSQERCARNGDCRPADLLDFLLPLPSLRANCMLSNRDAQERKIFSCQMNMLRLTGQPVFNQCKSAVCCLHLSPAHPRVMVILLFETIVSVNSRFPQNLLKVDHKGPAAYVPEFKPFSTLILSIFREKSVMTEQANHCKIGKDFSNVDAHIFFFHF